MLTGDRSRGRDVYELTRGHSLDNSKNDFTYERVTIRGRVGR
jgi:hypothetical protein